MCWCRPEIRTPNCDRVECHPPGKDLRVHSWPSFDVASQDLQIEGYEIKNVNVTFDEPIPEPDPVVFIPVGEYPAHDGVLTNIDTGERIQVFESVDVTQKVVDSWLRS